MQKTILVDRRIVTTAFCCKYRLWEVLRNFFPLYRWYDCRIESLLLRTSQFDREMVASTCKRFSQNETLFLVTSQLIRRQLYNLLEMQYDHVAVFFCNLSWWLFMALLISDIRSLHFSSSRFLFLPQSFLSCNGIADLCDQGYDKLTSISFSNFQFWKKRIKDDKLTEIKFLHVIQFINIKTARF